MAASVRKLRLRTSSIAEAVDDFRAGRLSDAIDGLRGRTSTEAAHLLARTWLRIGDASEALRALESAAGDETDARAEQTVLRAATLSRLGHHEGARSTIVDGIVQSISTGSSAREAEAFFYRGLIAFAAGDLDDAECDARAAAGVPEDLVPPRREDAMPLTATCARAHELIGLVRRSRSDYRGQLAPARESYELARRSPDRWIEAFSLSNLAVAVRDVGSPDAVALGAEIGARALEFPWTHDLGRREHTTYESLGTLAALGGDNVGAFRWYRRALEAARSPEERVLASLQRAFLARELNQDIIAHEELELALEIASGVDWERSIGDRRLALLVLAIAAAPEHVSAARAALDRYGALTHPVSTLLTSRFEKSTVALEAMAAGIVARHEGHAAAAIDSLERAIAIWSEIGFEWRVAQTALELSELGVEAYRGPAERAAADRAGSWLARRAAKLRAV